MDAVLLARIQFAMTIGFHFLFPPISIGLGWMLVVVETLGWRKADDTYVRMGRFFAKLMALTFAVGVATGIVMEFQFGMNWARYSTFVGDILGAPLAAEAVFAFFLESAFLGLYLFGRGKVSKGVHWFSALMVAVGATMSAFWILVVNSWQQTPAGFDVVAGRAVLISFSDAVFNPSMWYRFFHQLCAALITGAFFVGGVSAWQLLKGRGGDVAPKALRLSIIAGLVFAVLTVFPTGHEHGKQVARDQPEKFAALEGLYKTQNSAPLVMFGLFDAGPPPTLNATIEIPGLLSWMAFGDFNAQVKGIDAFPADQIPPLWMTFVSFHNMVMLGMLFIGVMGLGLLLMWRGRLMTSRWYHWMFFVVSPLPLAANQLGWISAEVGRQPWTVYKLLRTSESVSVTVGAPEILFSIILFGTVYLALGALYVFILFREMNHGPDAAGEVS
jgi:cytochrome d ubiquinol oxidase subunit I